MGRYDNDIIPEHSKDAKGVKTIHRPSEERSGLSEEQKSKQNFDERLGLIYGAKNVEDENVPTFALWIRIIGVTMVVAFVWWGLFYQWTYSKGPFEKLMSEFGFPRDASVIGAYVLAASILLVGWRQRFRIGLFFIAPVFMLIKAI